MKIIIEPNVLSFLGNNEEQLLKNESEHNLLLGLAEGISRNLRPSDNPLFYTLENPEGLKGQAIRTDETKPLILSKMNSKLIPGLVDFLKTGSLNLKGVIGPVDLAERFKDLWGMKAEVGMHQGIYQLDSVIHPDYDGGELILGKKEDKELVIKLCTGFVKDCFPSEKDPVRVATEAAGRHIENKSLFLWKSRDGKIVSMAANTRETRNGATLSWVYTPNEFRGKGYASSVVAALSHQLLEKKKFTNLFTDLLNPTSNSIYKKVGYEKIASSIHYNFT